MKYALIALATLSFLGCQNEAGPAAVRPGPPPIEFSFRKSQIPLKGVVAGLRNASDEEILENLVVRVNSPDEEGERSYRVETAIRPQDSITVGWMELDGWKLEPGQSLSVTCNGYAGTATIEVPKP